MTDEPTNQSDDDEPHADAVEPTRPAHAVLDTDRSGPAAFSLFRVWTLTMSTFTQLVRMKTFYFLIIFALIAFVWGQLDLIYTPAQKLRTITEVSLGVMWVFSWLFAIASTALLIPRDIEDRTLYTILAKPVSRLEYLLGKLGGVLLTIGISLVVMHLLYVVVLGARETLVMGAERTSLANDPRFTPEEKQAALDLIQSYGVRWEHIFATGAIFLQAAIIASIALLISTFASSTLFSIIISVMIFVIGHFHKLAVKYWVFQADGNAIAQTIGKAFGLFIPDFRLFDLNLAELIFRGDVVPAALFGELALLAVFYVAIYLLASLYLFIDKEF